MNGSVCATSEALTQLSELSKTIGSLVQEVDQLRSDNSRLQSLLRNKCQELNVQQNQNTLLNNKCQQLENELKILNNRINAETIDSFNSQDLWDSDSDEYLANISNNELMDGLELSNNDVIKNNNRNSLIVNPYNVMNRIANALIQRSDYQNVETNPIASTSKANNSLISSCNKSQSQSQSQTVYRREKGRVESNVSQVLNKLIDSTSHSHKRQTINQKNLDKIKITVCDMNNRRMIFQVNSWDTVLSLIRKLQERDGYSCAQHKLTYGGRQLSSESRLSDYSIKNGSVIRSIDKRIAT